MYSELLGCLEDHASLLRAMGNLEAAVRLCGAADAWRRLLALPRTPRAERKWADGVSALRAALGDDEFRRAWADGEGWEARDAVRWALSAEAASTPAAIALA